MNKLTPKDVIGNGLQKGNFTQTESGRHAVLEKFNTSFKLIDVNFFGEIFTKCIGDVNSIVKRGVSELEQTQRIVKKRIGFRTIPRDYNGNPCGSKKPTGNAKYATQRQIFGVLHPEHITLTCKRAKRDMMQDFYAVKENFVMKFHNMKVLAMQYVDDHITISDSFDIGFKHATERSYSYREMGYMLLNSRTIPKGNVFISISDYDELFGSYEDSIAACTKSSYGKARHVNLNFDIFVKEIQQVENIFDDQKQDMIQLCTVRVSYDGRRVNVEAYNTKFDGIDIAGMTKALVEEFDSFHDEFNEAVEAVKMKYHGEYLLHEICTTDGAI